MKKNLRSKLECFSVEKLEERKEFTFYCAPKKTSVTARSSNGGNGGGDGSTTLPGR